MERGRQARVEHKQISRVMELKTPKIQRKGEPRKQDSSQIKTKQQRRNTKSDANGITRNHERVRTQN